MLITTANPSLISGVSQQAENLRYSSQCTEQVNAYSSLIYGLIKRPPTQHIGHLQIDTDRTKMLSARIDRSDSERFLLYLGSKYAKVFDLAGNSYPILNESGVAVAADDMAYLECDNPRKDLRVVSLADYSIILNRTKTPALLAATTPTKTPEALVLVKMVRAASNYIIRLYNNPTDTVASYYALYRTIDSYGGDQGDVAANLAVSWAGADDGAGHITYGPYAQDLYDIGLSGGLIHFKKKDNSDFRVEVEASESDSMQAFKDTVQAFTMLPKKALVGFQIAVNGDPDSDEDNYYVKYVASTPGLSAGFTEGSWCEAQKLGLQDQIDPATMPHALLNYGDHFVFKALTWGSRSCGDAKTNPAPSFIGRQIRNIFFFRGRLGFEAGENIIISEASEFFNFWRTTVIQLLDSDPIDIAANGSTSRVSIMNSAAAISEKLVAFASKTQFVLDGGDMLTPKTVQLKQTSECENYADVDPLPVGNSIFFAFPRGSFSGFAEYAVSNDTSLFEAYDITEHVPNYIPGVVEYFTTIDTENLLLVKASGLADTLFVYRFYKRDGERLQSAWFKLQFGGTIRSVTCFGTSVYLLLERGGVLFLEKMDMTPGLVDTNSTFTTLLDRRVTEGACTNMAYNAQEDETSFDLPYIPGGLVKVLTRSTDSAAGGATLQVLRTDGTKVYLRGNYSTVPLWIGENYTMTMELTRPLLREQKANGQFLVIPGRFQVRNGLLAFNDSFYFRTVVTPRDRYPSIKEYVARSIGTDTSVVGKVPDPEDGVFRFPVYSKNDQVSITIINDSPYPSSLLSIDWEALYAARAQRV